MKFWTIQSKSVFDAIHENGFFQPEFRKSRYLRTIPQLSDLYSVILQAFNKINDTDLPGLIFAFAKCDGRTIQPIEDIRDFQMFVKSKKAVIHSFWKELDSSSIILELDYQEKFNPIFIDVNDFQFLMPPVMVLYPYTQNSVSRIYRDIEKGEITASEFQSNVIQAHLPNVRAENIVNSYPLFSID